MDVNSNLFELVSHNPCRAMFLACGDHLQTRTLIGNTQHICLFSCMKIEIYGTSKLPLNLPKLVIELYAITYMCLRS